jgi:hypothetical protein
VDVVQNGQRVGAFRRSMITRLRHTLGASRRAEWSTTFFRFVVAELDLEARAGGFRRSTTTRLQHTVGALRRAEWSTTSHGVFRVKLIHFGMCCA